MQTSTKLTLRLINNFLINNSEVSKKIVMNQLQLLSGKSLKEVKSNFIFKTLKCSIIESLKININNRSIKLYNEWYGKKIKTGLQNYMDSDILLIKLRKSFNILIIK